MFRSLISDCRAEILEQEAPSDDHPEAQTPPTDDGGGQPRKNKHDRAAERIGFVLSVPLGGMSRKKMMKMVPHIAHHFEKGYGKGEGEFGVVDADDLSTLGRHAQHISDQANQIRRMPGAAHHLAAHLMKHVANAHERMAHAAHAGKQKEAEDLHANEHERFRGLQKHHKLQARRAGIYDESY